MKIIIHWYRTLYSIWMCFPEKIRYLLVGGYNTLFSYILYALLLWLGFDKSPQLALFLSFAFSSVHNFWTQKIYVFNTKGNALEEYIRCLISWGISYILNVILLELFLILGLNPYVAQFLALVLITVNSYLLLKYLAFRPQ